MAKLTTSDQSIGYRTEVAAGTDTANASLIALFKRNLQRLTTLLAVLPASLGIKTAANAFPVVLASDSSLINQTVITGPSGQINTANNILAGDGTTATDVSGARSISLHIVPTGTVSSGVVTFEQSNDGTNWTGTLVTNATVSSSNQQSTHSPVTGTGNIIIASINTRYFRARISTAIGGGGSIQAIATVSVLPFSHTVFGANITQVGGGTAQTGNGTAGSGVLRVSNASDSTGQTSITGASANNGLLVFRSLSLVATGVSVKVSSGRVYGIHIKNLSASVRYVKFYNKATAPTVGTDTPVLTIPLSAGETFLWQNAMGVHFFSLGIGVGATNLLADTDTTAPTANDVVIHIEYV